MRSKDRLEELRHRSGGGGGGGEETGAWRPESCEMAELTPLDRDIKDTITEVERMRGWILELESNTKLVRRLHSDPTFHTNKHLQDHLESVVTQSNVVGLRVCTALRQFEPRARRSGDDAATRVSRLQYAATRRQLADALHHHHDALHALRDDRLHLLHDQIRLTNLTISEEECQALLESNSISLFVNNIETETAETRRVLREVETRHEELARVEAALRQVKELFMQIALLVAQQQEQIDSVEYFALQATAHVELGGQQLLKGTVSRTKTRKKKLSVIICVASGLLVVLLVLVLT